MISVLAVARLTLQMVRQGERWRAARQHPPPRCSLACSSAPCPMPVWRTARREAGKPDHFDTCLVGRPNFIRVVVGLGFEPRDVHSTIGHGILPGRGEGRAHSLGGNALLTSFAGDRMSASDRERKVLLAVSRGGGNEFASDSALVHGDDRPGRASGRSR